MSHMLCFLGYVYLDDEHTLSHESGVFVLRSLSFSSDASGTALLRCTTAESFAQADSTAITTDKDGENICNRLYTNSFVRPQD